MQSGKQADHLLRELGAYVFLSEPGRIQPDSETKVAGIMGQLDALDAAGTPVTIVTDPFAVLAGGALPKSSAVPQSGTPSPPPVESAAPPTGNPGPQPGEGLPETGGAIPRSGGSPPG